MAKNRKTTKRKSLTLDLSGVETSRTIPEGIYVVEVSDVEAKSSVEGNPYLSFTFTVLDGKSKGQKLFHNCSLQPQALFNLKAVLIALDFEIPEGEFDLDTDLLIGLSCAVEVAHEVYEGKKKARITDFIEESDDCEEDDNGEEEDTEDSEVDLENLDMEELKELAKELGIAAKKIKKAKTEEDLIELIEEESDEDEIAEAVSELFSEEDEEEEEDDEDEEEDYESLTLKELKAIAKERGIKLPKKASKDDIIELIEDDDEE